MPAHAAAHGRFNGGEFTPAVAARTAALYERVRTVIPDFEWPAFAPDIDAIMRLKRERNAIVLAHNYQTPEIFHCIADIVGDSLALAREAARAEAEVIVLCGVHFMAETAKLLNPDKTVLIPDPRAGCSLAESITAADVRRLRERHPGVPVVTYVNTSAEVKAESDVCCTSANAVKVVEAMGSERVIFLPDEYLAKHVATQTSVEIITWHGHCEVHERFTRRGGPALPRGVRRPGGDRPPGMSPGRARGRRFRRLDRADDRVRADAAPGPHADADRMFDERQCRGRADRYRVRPAVQPVPAHEAHHAAQDPARTRGHDSRGGRRP